jgi:fermentation-respiration switch protein FrsA (DUF1100 family)
VWDRIRPVIRIVAVVAGVSVCFVAALWLAQRRLIYLPERDLDATPSEAMVTTVETTDGITHRVWVVPAAGRAMARVVVFNGNAGNMSHRVTLARSLAAERMEVLLFDYRGYGDTDGRPSEEGLLIDADAVARLAFDATLPVVYLGESLGAGVATALARRTMPDALVMRSPFTSLADVARAHYPLVPTTLLRDRYPVEETVRTLEMPLLVVLGTADSIVPPEQSRRVFEAAPGPKSLVEMEGLDHNDPGLSSGSDLAREVRVFVEQATGGRSHSR